MKKLLTWAQRVQEVYRKAGEDEFSELKDRDKNTILKELVDTGYDYDTDGDCDAAFLIYNIGDVSITFQGHSDSSYPEDMKGCLDDMSIEISDNSISINDLVEYIREHIADGIKMVNLTPHAVTFYAPDGNTILRSVPSTGVARAMQNRDTIGEVNGIPVSKTSYGAVEGLPDSVDGTIYIVSVLTAQAAPERDDLYITDDIVRDAEGRILGCKSLAQI